MMPLWCMLAAAAVHYVAYTRRAPHGLNCLLASLPLLVCLTALPFVHQKATVRGSLAFVTSWLSSFKLLAAAVGRGPLARRDTTAAQHAALLLLPLTPAGTEAKGLCQNGCVSRQAHPATAVEAAAGADPLTKPCSCQPSVHHVLLELVAASGVILLLQAAPWLPAAARHVLYAIIVWLAVSVLVDVPSALLGPALGLRLAPCMRQPYRAAGLGEFWGRRYNLVVSSTLRFSVFEPVMQVLRCCNCTSQEASSTEAGADRVVSAGGKLQGRKCSSRERCRHCWVARAVATTAAFAVSGLMHELCVWHMCQTSYVEAGTFLPGRHLLFFLLQSPLLLLERNMLLRDGRSSTPPPPSAAARVSQVTNSAGVQHLRASRPTSSWQQVQHTVLTFAVLFFLAEWLFWPPLEACKSDVNGVAEIADGLLWLGQVLWGHSPSSDK